MRFCVVNTRERQGREEEREGERGREREREGERGRERKIAPAAPVLEERRIMGKHLRILYHSES